MYLSLFVAFCVGFAVCWAPAFIAGASWHQRRTRRSLDLTRERMRQTTVSLLHGRRREVR